MALLQTLGTGQGYLKAGFLGFSKSGKTYTAVELALGCWNYFGRKGRVVFFDTEGGSEYIAARVKEVTGADLIGLRSRSFDDLMTITRELKQDDILLVDSITHVWRELCDSYMAQLNKSLAKRNLRLRQKLEFQDWNAVKGKWSAWPDWYLNSKVHAIICGRAGYDYDMETNEETGKKELVKTGVKMKAEAEFGFEPSLLVEMERIQELGDKIRIYHQATVIGDRFNVIDGKQAKNPDFKFFEPHLAKLKPGAHAPIDTEPKTDAGINDEGDSDWQHDKRERQILCEEIAGVIANAYPSQTTEHKQARQKLLQAAFETYSWTRVESLDARRLRDGIGIIQDILHQKPEAVHDKPMETDEALFRSLPMNARINAFGEIKQKLIKAFGPAGESEYRRILTKHGCKDGKSNQFKGTGEAWAAYSELIDHAEKLVESLKQDEPQPVPVGAAITDEDVPF